MNSLTITDANHAGISKLVSSAENGESVTLSRHGRPVAVLISSNEFDSLREDRETLRDAALVMTRMATDTGARTDLDQAMDVFGIDRSQLESEIESGLHSL